MQDKKKGSHFCNYLIQRAENGTQTRDPQLGRLAGIVFVDNVLIVMCLLVGVFEVKNICGNNAERFTFLLLL